MIVRAQCSKGNQMKTNLLIDGKFMAYRAITTQFTLTSKETRTGMYYGFINSLKAINKKYNPNNIIIMWDSNYSFRKEIYPEYKSKRNKISNENVLQQLIAIKDEYENLVHYMDDLGFASYLKHGLEADDLFYYFVNQYKEDRNIIVTKDEDLYQLLRKDHVDIYDPQKKVIYNEKSFENEYGLQPRQWPLVKAIGGCKSDNVKVIRGVSQETAVKYVKGDTIETGKKRLIEKSNKEIELGLQLVKLPFCSYTLLRKKTCFNMNNFISFCQKMNFKSFLDKLDDFRKLPQCEE